VKTESLTRAVNKPIATLNYCCPIRTRVRFSVGPSPVSRHQTVETPDPRHREGSADEDICRVPQVAQRRSFGVNNSRRDWKARSFVVICGSMSRNGAWWIAVIAVLIVVTSWSVEAQNVRETDVSFGYQWQYISRCSGGTTFCKDDLPAGWYFDASGGIARMFRWVGQFGWRCARQRYKLHGQTVHPSSRRRDPERLQGSAGIRPSTRACICDRRW
jgi:hypothetical protein